MGQNRLVGGILLVAGTTIGAGMLALPVITGFAGFIPSFLLLLAFWVYMTFTAFLLLEVTLSMEDNVNMMTMAKRILGRGGEVVSWVTYLFLLYSLTTAYIAGSGPIIADFVYGATGYAMPSWANVLPLLGIFGFFVYMGTKSVDYINRLLMIGLVIAYGAMVIFLSPHVKPDLLAQSNWKYLYIAVSVVATSFGFHIIIPSLTAYMNRDKKLLIKAILIGSIIPLIVYLVWELLTLGIIPLSSVKTGYLEGANGAHLLSGILGSSSLAMIARLFSFFAIVTSFLGVSLSLSDFLADGFKIKKTRAGRAILYILTFLPPLIFTLTDPRAFLSALEYAGAFGVVILLGLLPALMAWRGRYYQNYHSTLKVPGGKIALLLAMAFSISVILLEIASKAGWLNILHQN